MLWKCPLCGEPMKVVYIYHKGDSVAIRKRKCTKCSKTIMTSERQRD
jgi:transcriptional regulator NrdR family protein